MHSDNKSVQFLHKVSSRAQPSNTELKKIGSSTPLFRTQSIEKEKVTSLLDGALQLEGMTTSATGLAERPAKPESASPVAEEENKEEDDAQASRTPVTHALGIAGQARGMASSMRSISITNPIGSMTT